MYSLNACMLYGVLLPLGNPVAQLWSEEISRLQIAVVRDKYSTT